MTKIKLVVAGLLLLGVGYFAGHRGAASTSYLNGRLSACKDITSVINSWSGFGLACVVADGDVWITTPLNDNEQVSLDGQRVRNN